MRILHTLFITPCLFRFGSLRGTDTVKFYLQLAFHCSERERALSQPAWGRESSLSGCAERRGPLPKEYFWGKVGKKVIRDRKERKK